MIQALSRCDKPLTENVLVKTPVTDELLMIMLQFWIS